MILQFLALLYTALSTNKPIAVYGNSRGFANYYKYYAGIKFFYKVPNIFYC